MTTLADFILARIAEDEAVAREATQRGRWADDDTTPWVCDEQTDHVAMHPARVLAQCEAVRRIVEEHADVDPCDAHDASFETIDCDTLRALALPYADHPEFREEWRP